MFGRGDMEEVLLETLVTGDVGQAAVATTEMLPKEIRGADKGGLEKLGFVFGEDADDLFVRVALPEGWSKVRTGYNLFTHLLDEKGRKRGLIFYKVARSDRDAWLSMQKRFAYTTSRYGAHVRGQTEWVAVVMSDEGVVWESEPLRPEPDAGSDREGWLAWQEERGALSEQAVAWLDEHYPDWRDVAAYWD